MADSLLMVGNFLSAAVGNRSVCEDLAERLAACGWSVLTTSSRRARTARLTDMLASAWGNRRRYDVAHVDVYSGAAFFWAEAVACVLRRAGKPYALTLHGGALPAFAARWKGRVEHLLTSAAAVTAPSRYLVDSMRIYRSDLRLIPNGIELSQYPYRLREEACPHLIWLRAFHRIYDPVLAVQVLALLRQRGWDADLTMIGPDKGDGSLLETRDAVRRLQVGAAVRFSGSVPKADTGRSISAGDIFLNTTTIDNAPVSVLEAMACGSCIVSTNAGGIPQLVRDGRTALLVKPGDAEGMAAAVARILKDRELAATLSAQAHADSAAFDWSRIVPQWHQLLRSLQCV
jgi:glycosyltransferase involved in cell wall biosynthesis